MRLSDCFFFVGSRTPFAPLAFCISDYNFDSTVTAIFRAFDAQALALEANGLGRRKFGYCFVFSFRRVPLPRRRASFALLREELRLVALKVHHLKPERAKRLFREAVRVARLSKQPPHSKNCVRFGFRPNAERLVS
ncbi:hypothetical protein C4553_00380 [Candidatus Parcubacteria bacterium]|nr:MAG: hypothetical protein C4553_00380 [Candidatus Parcubacteria bacterium]